MPDSRGPRLLNHRELSSAGAAPRARLFFLHGFFGAMANWASIARGLVRTRPDWGAVLVDLRLHGDSLGFVGPHTLAACAEDVGILVEALRPSTWAILGHSFGGKVAIAVASAARSRPLQVWVVDSGPGPYAAGGGIRRMLELLRRLPDRYASRSEAVHRLSEAGLAPATADWIVMNLVRRAGAYEWRASLDDMAELLAHSAGTDLWPVVEEPPAGTELIFLRAEGESALDAGSAGRISTLEADGHPVRLRSLPGGHWLNVDNPDGLLRILSSSLPRA